MSKTVTAGLDNATKELIPSTTRLATPRTHIVLHLNNPWGNIFTSPDIDQIVIGSYVPVTGKGWGGVKALYR